MFNRIGYSYLAGKILNANTLAGTMCRKKSNSANGTGSLPGSQDLRNHSRHTLLRKIRVSYLGIIAQDDGDLELASRPTAIYYKFGAGFRKYSSRK